MVRCKKELHNNFAMRPVAQCCCSRHVLEAGLRLKAVLLQTMFQLSATEYNILLIRFWIANYNTQSEVGQNLKVHNRTRHSTVRIYSLKLYCLQRRQTSAVVTIAAPIIPKTWLALNMGAPHWNGYGILILHLKKSISFCHEYYSKENFSTLWCKQRSPTSVHTKEQRLSGKSDLYGNFV